MPYIVLMTNAMTCHAFWFINMCNIVDTFFTLNDKYFCMDFLDMFCLILLLLYMIAHVLEIMYMYMHIQFILFDVKCFEELNSMSHVIVIGAIKLCCHCVLLVLFCMLSN